MDQLIFTESGDFLLERVEHLDAKAPKYLHEAWRKAKQDKIKNFKGLQDMPYEKKIERQKDIAFEFFDEMQKTGRSCHVSVGGLDSITLYVWLLSIGIDVPAISVTSIEDVSIQKVHKALGITRVVPLKSKIQVLQEFGFPVISKKIAGRIDMLQHASPDNATVRHAIITGECGEQGHFAKNSRMQLPQKWLKLFGGWDPDEGQLYGHPDFKVSKDCCYWVKEKPCDDWAREHNSKPYLGLMAIEGGQREEALVEHGCNYYGKNAVRSCPFAVFLRDDVLRLAQEMDEWYHSHLDMFEKKFYEQPYGHYPDGRLKEYKPVESIIPLIYGEIRQYEDGTRYTTKAQRTGCSMCGFGIHLEKRPHRFDRLRQTNPKEWEFLMYRCCVDEKTGERYGWGRVLDYIGVGWEDIPPVQITIEDYLKEVADEEMIRSGEKKEEYRSLSPYYAARFKTFLGLKFIPASQAQVERALRARGSVSFKDIILRAGYSAFAPAIMISGYITISTGRPEWGAAEGEEYYVLHITGMEDLLTDDWSRKTGKKTKLTGACEDWRPKR